MFVAPLLDKVEEGSLSALRILKCDMDIIDDGEHMTKIEAAEKVIQQIDLKELSAYFGVSNDMDYTDDEGKLLKARMIEMKKILSACLKGQVQAKMKLEESAEEVEQAQKLFKKYMFKDNESYPEFKGQAKEDKAFLAECEKYLAKQEKRLGTLLKLTYKALKPDEKGDLKAAPSKKQHEEVLKVLKDLGWVHIAARYELEREVCFPQGYREF